MVVIPTPDNFARILQTTLHHINACLAKPAEHPVEALQTYQEIREMLLGRLPTTEENNERQQ